MIAVLQARLGSNRLPGKAFFTFFGQNMVERSIGIAQEIKAVERVVLATGNDPRNLALEPYVKRMGAEFFVGSEDNVLERFCQATKGYKGEYLLRMTCDNYLIQPELIEEMYQLALKADADYAHIAPLSHFSGEIVRVDALRSCFVSEHTAEAREHVTWDIRSNKSLVTAALPDHFMEINHQYSLTLDTLDDLLMMKKLELAIPELKNYRCISTLKQLIHQLTA